MKTLRGQLTAVLIAVMTAVLLIVGMANHFFLGSFYRSQKTKRIRAAYEAIDALDMEGGSDFTSEILKMSVEDNLQILVADGEFGNIISTSRDAQILALRLFSYGRGFYARNVEVISKNSKYTIQKTPDPETNTNFLELWGKLGNGMYLLIRTPLEGIETAAHLSNIFYYAVGFAVTLLAVIFLIFYAKKITRPLAQLSELSNKMADLDFDVKYTGRARNEIDELGANFNRMSDELEKAVSDLKAANIELQKDVEEKTQIDNERKEFLNNVSHELKTPIALVRGYAEGLRDNVASDPESRDYYCSVIIDEAEKMDSLVKKLLTLSRLESGHEQVQMERFDLIELIGGVLRGMQIMIEESGAKVTWPENGHVEVWGDPFEIEEVLTNYLSNAIHHLDGERRIDIRVEAQGNVVVTSVFNTGDPIPEEDIDRIWDKFYKVDKARSREYGGSGIGLSIVKAIMERHKEHCYVQNYDNGVAFCFTLSGTGSVLRN